MFGGLEGGGLFETILLCFYLSITILIVWIVRGPVGRLLDKISPFPFLNEGGSYKYNDFYRDITPKGQVLWILVLFILIIISVLLSFGFYWVSLVSIFVGGFVSYLLILISSFDDDFLGIMRDGWEGSIVLPDFEIGTKNTAGNKIPRGIGFEAERGIPLINLTLNKSLITPKAKDVMIKVVDEGIIIDQINDDEFDKKILWEEINYVSRWYTHIFFDLKKQGDLEISAPKSLGVLKRYRFVIELKNFVDKQIKLNDNN